VGGGCLVDLCEEHGDWASLFCSTYLYGRVKREERVLCYGPGVSVLGWATGLGLTIAGEIT
jgi:hypothetical protein